MSYQNNPRKIFYANITNILDLHDVYEKLISAFEILQSNIMDHVTTLSPHSNDNSNTFYAFRRREKVGKLSCHENFREMMLRSRALRIAILVLICLLVSLIYVLNPETEIDILIPVAHPQVSGFKRHSNHVQRDEDQSINVKERLHFPFDFGGTVFNDQGKAKDIGIPVTTSLVHSFSPYIEREAAKRFLDPAHDNIYYANSPAILWFKNELVLVSRIWLDRELYEPKDNWPANHFADNWLYTQKFDHDMKPISNGSIIGIPAPKQWWVGDGPIEPRLFKVKGRLFATFNSAMAFKVKYYMDYTVMWDLDQNIAVIPQIEGGTPMVNATEKDDMPRDKHWMALVDNDQLYFVHNLDPFRVMKCELDGQCKFIHNDQNKKGFIFEHSTSHLRGGTPFELWQYPYYISVAHATLYKQTNFHRFYSAHIVVICVKPWKVVYVSNDIRIHPLIYQSTPMVRNKYIDDGFIFPVGIILENLDTLDIGVHVNDHSSVIIRMKGMKTLMNKVIEVDQREKSEKGPPIGHLHKHIHDVMETLAKTKFVHPKE
ncbi:hypothetical protein CAPTEDRAFT_187274 [Capitella teleta]|uniref:Uncharacterized protein n=1 Tax=Capitella teleta TaxID=283909 RepID=X1ZK35_CAPTE|nr:hypothetical protein CAPTEDRAFT_187274 [Capitella teleta]|eukprot:ELU10111.1 hypothetical protein CAPTEDRAFT_187274 [Capitella teleta]